MFNQLQEINTRPAPFEFYTAADLWTDEYTSQKMLEYHLNEQVDISSRKADFIDRSVDWILSRFDIHQGKKIIDFGCGPGLYTTRLAKKGAEVTGIDFSHRSIDYARQQASEQKLSINYIHQNYLDFDTNDQFDLILMIMCDFCALSPTQRTHILQTFYKILKPGGSVLLDVYTIKAFNQREETAVYEKNLLDQFWSPAPYYGFLNTFKYEDQKVILDKYTLIEANRTRTVYNWLQYFSKKNLSTGFEQAGFVVDQLHGDVAGSPFNPESLECAIIAKKI